MLHGAGKYRSPPEGRERPDVASRANEEGPLERPPSRRKFSEPTPSRLQDSDASARVRRLRAFVWALPGAFIGFLGGFYVAVQLGGPGAAFYPLVGGAAAGAITYLAVMLISDAAGSAAAVIYNPSGSSVPYERQHSYAASLAARGQHEDAVLAYELIVAEHPGEPEPYLRLARLLRDEMGRYEDAARWFRRARTETVLPPAREVLVSRELIELYRDWLDAPLKAAPELARLAEMHGDTPDGEWAARELAGVKEVIRARRSGPAGSSEPSPGP